MSAAIVEGDVALFCPPENNPSAVHMEQLHLIDLELVFLGNNGWLVRPEPDLLFLPCAGLGITMVYPNLIAIHQHPTHPPTDGQERHPDAFEHQHGRPGECLRITPHGPSSREQDDGSKVGEHVFCRPTLA